MITLTLFLSLKGEGKNIFFEKNEKSHRPKGERTNEKSLRSFGEELMKNPLAPLGRGLG
jgi:hypothetical protein